MHFYTTDLYGETRIDPSATQRRVVLASVLSESAEVDHPDVFLTHRDGPTLIYREGGVLVRELENERLSTLGIVPLEEAERIWDLLVAEDWVSLEALPWQSLDCFE